MWSYLKKLENKRTRKDAVRLLARLFLGGLLVYILMYGYSKEVIGLMGFLSFMLMINGRIGYLACLSPLILMFYVGSQSPRSDFLILLIMLIAFEYFLFGKIWRRKEVSWSVFRTGFVFVTFSLLWWVFTSAANHLLRPDSLSLNSERLKNVRQHEAVPSFKKKNIAIALSGGGFRAALFHSGILHQLEQNHIAVTHISSVSGGSIIGSYYVAGGPPENFKNAVAEGRFFFPRYLFDVQNFFKVILGLETRTETFAHMVNTVLLGGGEKSGRLMDFRKINDVKLLICTSDIYRGLLVGWTPSGYVVYGAPRWIETDKDGNSELFNEFSARWENLEKSEVYRQRHLSLLVGASGAFPGAFNTVQISMLDGQDKDGQNQKELSKNTPENSFFLSDGGLLDNSGVSLLLAAIHLANQKKHEKDPIHDWSDLDLIIESDASAIPGKPEEMSEWRNLVQSANVVYEDSQTSTKIVNQNYAKAKRIHIIRLSPHRFYLPSPMFSPEELKKLHGNIINSNESNSVNGLKNVIKGFPGYEKSVGEKDFSFLLEIFQQELIKSKIRQAILDVDLATIKKALKVKPVESAIIDEDKFATFREKARAKHSFTRIKTLNPRFLKPESEAVDNALSNYVAKFDNEVMETLFRDILFCFEIYRKTDTLKNELTAEESDSLFRLGRYITLLSYPKIKKTLLRHPSRGRFRVPLEKVGK